MVKGKTFSNHCLFQGVTSVKLQPLCASSFSSRKWNNYTFLIVLLWRLKNLLSISLYLYILGQRQYFFKSLLMVWNGFIKKFSLQERILLTAYRMGKIGSQCRISCHVTSTLPLKICLFSLLWSGCLIWPRALRATQSRLSLAPKTVLFNKCFMDKWVFALSFSNCAQGKSLNLVAKAQTKAQSITARCKPAGKLENQDLDITL